MWSRQKVNADVVAEVVDGSLVIALTEADTPKLWRTTMDKFSVASFEVREKNGQHVLTMVNDQQTEDIATFAEKEDAVYALRVVMSAMTGGGAVSSSGGSHKKSTLVARKPQTSATQGQGVWHYAKKFFKFLIWTIVVCGVLFVTLPLLFPNAPGNGVPVNKMKQAEKGAPIPADELFGN